MPCPELLRSQAYFDDQVDALAATDIERHLADCAECTALRRDLEGLRMDIRSEVPPLVAPPALRARILRTLDDEDRAAGRPPTPHFARWRAASFWSGAAGGVGATALAAAMAFFLIAPPVTNPLLDDLANAQMRSLMPGHLIDVESTDKHTVKPWFAGHADASPVVTDFEPQGYRLIGGRADYFEHQRAAVVVYQHGAHIINVFSWIADGRGLPKDDTRNGYRMAFWRTGNLAYCAVSDTGWDELLGLVRLLRNANGADNPR
jgi:anti-sigma factor RsiW